MGTVVDYTKPEVDAARRVLLLVVDVLQDYHDAVAVVGGWVPHLAIPDSEEEHVGSIDVDLVIDRDAVQANAYVEIHERLTAAGFSRTRSPFCYSKAVEVGGEQIVVQVDFLDGYGESIGFLKPMRVDSAAFAVQESTTVSVAGTDVLVRMTSVPALIVMKGHAIAGRAEDKDAYDVYYCLKNFPGGARAIAEGLRPHLQLDVVQAALRALAASFSSVDATGPRNVAEFLEHDGEEADITQREAFELVQELLNPLQT